MRDIIIQNQKRLALPKDLMAVIKPGKESIYKNAVDALDEMTINDVMRYAMVDIYPVESKLIETTEQGKRTGNQGRMHAGPSLLKHCSVPSNAVFL